jgi:hypothetical protein
MSKAEKKPLQDSDDVRVNLIVSMETRKRWKTAAIAENRSMSEMIIAVVSQYLDEKDEQMNK